MQTLPNRQHLPYKGPNYDRRYLLNWESAAPAGLDITGPIREAEVYFIYMAT